jgi:hypothetical protein
MGNFILASFSLMLSRNLNFDYIIFRIMRKIAFVLAGALFGAATVGTAAHHENVVIESKYDGNKTKVEQHELPQEVIQSLEESEYQNWELQEAYRVQDEMTNEVHYELHLASDVDAQKVKNVTFNEDGEIISEEDSELGRTDDQQFDQQQHEPGLERTDPGMDQGTEPGIEEGVEPGREEQQQQY